jgi:hypothetical protein
MLMPLFRRSARWMAPAFLLAGCGSQPPITTAPSPVLAGMHRVPGAATQRDSGRSPRASWIDPHAAGDIAAGVRHVFYIADNGTTVGIYTIASAHLIGQLMGFTRAEALAVDGGRNLYVPDQTANEIKVFHAGATTPYKTLSDPRGPQFAAIGTHGYVYAGNADNTVAVYKLNATSPSYYLTVPTNLYLFGLAVDGAGNVYVSYAAQPSGYGYVGEFAAKTTTFTPLNVEQVISGSIAVDASGDLIGASEYYIDTYYPGNNTSTPSTQFLTPYPEATFALTATNADLFGANVNAHVDRYAYPSGSLVYTAPINGLYIATSPASPLGVWHP